MLFRHKMAGALTIYGLAGLTMASLIAPHDAATANTSSRTVSLAITSGPQLRLISANELENSRPGIAPTKLVCRRVYRLAFANIGFTCQTPAAQSTVVPEHSAATIAMAKDEQ